MKKVFLLSLGLILGLAGFAQEKVNMKSNVAKQSAVTTVMTGYENPAQGQYAPSNVLPSAHSQILRDGEVWSEEETMITQYDLQSNSAIGNRMYAWEDGSVAVVATWDGIGSNTSSWPDRGTGYNYYDGSSWGDMPEARFENEKTGWPSICGYQGGEILANHSSGVNIYWRPTKGEGDWTKLTTLADWTWPRVACTEDGTLQLVCCQSTSVNVENIVGYFTSTDGGNTWTQVAFFDNLNTEYNKLIAADDYVMAVNGNDVAVLFNSAFYDIFYAISHDSGATWEKKVIAACPMGVLDWNNVTLTDNDTVWASDNSGSIAIGNDGTVHVAFGLGRVRPSSETVGSYNYWPYTVGIVYWNSNYENEQGGNEILPMGQWSVDAEHPEWALNGEGGINNTLCYDRLIEMAWAGYLESGDPADINPNLNIFGWASEKEPGTPASWSDLWDNNWGVYRTIGISTLPVVCVDDNNNVVVFFNSLSDARVHGEKNFYFRSAFMHRRVNGVWMAPNTEYSFTSEAHNIMHLVDEIYATFGCPNTVNGAYWFAYSADNGLGLFLDEDQTEVTDNTLYVLKLTDIDGVEETKDVVYSIFPNPATDYICISSEANVNANITFVNLAGQTVKSINKSLAMGQNTVSIDLESGVYFCTVTANGFSKTTKVVVK